MVVHVAIAQMKVSLGESEQNLLRARQLLQEAKARGAELVIMPELWSTGYALAEANRYGSARNAGIFEKIGALAREFELYLCGSVIEAEEGSFFNTQTISQSRRLPLLFQGNKVFSSQELVKSTDDCLAKALPNYNTDSEARDYCLRGLRLYFATKGYLQAVVGNPREEKVENQLRLIVPITEGVRYRLGEVKVEGARLFAPAQILEMLTLRTGDIVNVDRITEWLNNRVRSNYANFGYIQYSAEPTPYFHPHNQGQEGVVDCTVTIDEGMAFTIRSIRFEGNGEISAGSLLEDMLVRENEIFNRGLFDQSLKRINQSGRFEPIDVDKDVDYKWDRKSPQLDLTVHLKRKRM